MTVATATQTKSSVATNSAMAAR
uniref:Uncharacterized protein n=1 Tax=Arundo donax TaxID=35708 RepID=A0A0A9BWR9_ARUDO